MCVQQTYNCSNELYVRHGESLSVYLQNKVLPAFISGVDTLENDQLLEEFLRRWSNFKMVNNWYRKIFMHLVSIGYNVAVS